MCPLLYVCLMLRLTNTAFSAVLIYRRVALSSGKKKGKPVPSVKEQATTRNEKQTETKKKEREGGGGVFYLLLSLLCAVQNFRSPGTR